MKAIGAETIAAAIAGDQDAAQQIYRSALGRAQRAAFGIMRSFPNDQEDAVQEVMAHLFRQLPKFRGESAFSTWSHRVIHNHLLMQLRTKRADKHPGFCVEALDSSPDEERSDFYVVPDTRDSFSQVDAAIDARRIMARMPKGYRKALEMREIHGFTYEECSRITGKTVGCEKSQWSHAKKRAKEIAEDMDNFEEEPGYNLPDNGDRPTIAAPIVEVAKARKAITKRCACSPNCDVMFETLSYASKFAPGHNPKLIAKKSALPRQPNAAIAPAAAPAEPIDMLQLNVPVRSLDKMFAMLPPDLKKRALGAFLMEM